MSWDNEDLFDNSLFGDDDDADNPSDSRPDNDDDGGTGKKRKGDDPDGPAPGLGLDQEVSVAKRARVPAVKLDEERLLSEMGIPKLRRSSAGLRFKGKGHEFSDAARLLNFYQMWLDDLFPKARFLDALAMVEKTGHKRNMVKARVEWIEEDRRRKTSARFGLGDPFADDGQDPFGAVHGAAAIERSLPVGAASAAAASASAAAASAAAASTAAAAAATATADVPEEAEEPPEDEDLHTLLAEAEKQYKGAQQQGAQRGVQSRHRSGSTQQSPPPPPPPREEDSVPNYEDDEAAMYEMEGW